MLQEYIQENKTLKSENSQLEKFREKIRQQHEVLTRENEKLARKLEQLLRTQGPAGGNNNPEIIIVDQPVANSNIHAVKTLPRIEKQAGYPVEVVS